MRGRAFRGAFRRAARVVVGLLAAGVLLAPLAARAQVDDVRARAEALFREGRRSAVVGDYAAAYVKFAASQRLDPSTGTLLNLGDCEEHEGHMLRARNYYQTALSQLGDSDPRVTPARERLAALEARLPRLTVTLASPSPPGTVVVRDGTPVPPAGFGVATPVEPGEHVIAVTSPGRREARETVVLGQTETREIIAAPGDVEPPIAAPAARAVASTARRAPPQPSSGAPIRSLGWIAGGVGLVGVAVAGLSWFILQADRSTVTDPLHCDMQRRCDAVGLAAASSGKTWLAVNTAAWVVGLAGVGGGAFLLLATPGSSDQASLGLVPVAGGVALGARGRFGM